MMMFDPEDNFNSDNVVITNNPYDIDINTGYDNYISSSTVLMDGNTWDSEHN